MHTVLSLFDYTGNWPKPYADAGYRVVTIDIKNIPDSLRYKNRDHYQIDLKKPFTKDRRGLVISPDVILAAPPCTEFAGSGARWWANKDPQLLIDAVTLIQNTLEHINYCKQINPNLIWALENPVGRLASSVPELGKPKIYFNPCDYAGYLDNPADEAYTKKTGLWGNFTVPVKKAVEPDPRGFPGWYKLGGKSERTKELRSVTPLGFAKAFALANDPAGLLQ